MTGRSEYMFVLCVFLVCLQDVSAYANAHCKNNAEACVGRPHRAETFPGTPVEGVFRVGSPFKTCSATDNKVVEIQACATVAGKKVTQNELQIKVVAAIYGWSADSQIDSENSYSMENGKLKIKFMAPVVGLKTEEPYLGMQTEISNESVGEKLLREMDVSDVIRSLDTNVIKEIVRRYKNIYD